MYLKMHNASQNQKTKANNYILDCSEEKNDYFGRLHANVSYPNYRQEEDASC